MACRHILFTENTPLKEIYDQAPLSLAYMLARTEMAYEYIVVYCKSDVANIRTMFSRFSIT
jgi:hypothetical protein